MMQHDWWWDVNTLLFERRSVFHARHLQPEIKRFFENVSADYRNAAMLYLDTMLLTVAADAVTSVWCRRGDSFVAGTSITWGRLRAQHRRSRGLLENAYPSVDTPYFEIDAAVRMCISNMDSVRWTYLFQQFNQWYSCEVAPRGLTLQDALPQLTVIIASADNPGLRCTFKPWALYTETGELSFYNE